MHWVLLEVDVDRRSIKLFDSLGTNHKYQHDLLKIVSQTLKDEIYPRNEWKYEIVEGMQQQSDTYTCGIFVTAWAENAKNTGWVQNCLNIGDGKKFRKKMLEALVRSRVDNTYQKNSLHKNNQRKEENEEKKKMIVSKQSTNWKSEQQPKLDKNLHKRTISKIKLMINECITPLKSHKNKLLKIINGEWIDEVMFTFMNYITSKEFMEEPEYISNDDTFWSWCRWAMATINQKDCNVIASKDFKGLRRNGEISKSIMNKYIEIVGMESRWERIVIQKVVHIAKGYENGVERSSNCKN